MINNQKQIYFVTATNTDIGKTYACEVLLKKFAQDKKKVGYLKPFETGVIDTPLDGTKLLNIAKSLNNNYNLTIDDIVPFQFKLPASPFVASRNDDENKLIDLDLVFQAIDTALEKCDTLIIEGAGGLYVPILQDYFIIDLIKEIQDRYQSRTILISPSSLGSINDTLLSQNLLKQSKIKFDWYINLYKDKDSFDKVTLPFYKQYFKEDGIKYQFI